MQHLGNPVIRCKGLGRIFKSASSNVRVQDSVSKATLTLKVLNQFISHMNLFPQELWFFKIGLKYI